MFKIGRTALGRMALGRMALGRMALGRNFPGRGRFGTLLSHPALLLATGNRGLSPSSSHKLKLQVRCSYLLQ